MIYLLPKEPITIEELQKKYKYLKGKKIKILDPLEYIPEVNLVEANFKDLRVLLYETGVDFTKVSTLAPKNRPMICIELRDKLNQTRLVGKVTEIKK